jgi:uncharacterized protein YggE
LNFTIDDPENLKTQAKAKALDDARVKAQMLAQKLGFRLGGVMGYYENDMSAPDYYAPKYDMAMGMGGGAMPTAPASISSGSKDVTMGVSVIYEILQ